MSGADLVVKMQQKISQEMYKVNLSSPVFIGDSKIILRMIAKNDPTDLPIFYSTRVMEIAVLTNSDDWFWCPGHLNPADLLTRSDTTLEQINSDFWLHESFLPQPDNSWPVKKCASFLSSSLPLTTINQVIDEPVHPLSPSSSPIF